VSEYKPELPADVKLPEGHSINTAHADYKALEALAKEEGWSQASFSKVLGLEAKRTMAKAAAAPTPAPKPPLPANFSKMSTREQFTHALTTRSNRGA
jgi:hypothetical protein